MFSTGRNLTFIQKPWYSRWYCLNVASEVISCLAVKSGDGYGRNKMKTVLKYPGARIHEIVQTIQDVYLGFYCI